MGDLAEGVAALLTSMLAIGFVCARFARANGMNSKRWFVLGTVFNLPALAYLSFRIFREFGTLSGSLSSRKAR